MKYTDIETSLLEVIQFNLYIGRSGMDWKDALLNTPAIRMRKRMACKHREEDEVKWREKLITIGKDQERFLETENPAIEAFR